MLDGASHTTEEEEDVSGSISIEGVKVGRPT